MNKLILSISVISALIALGLILIPAITIKLLSLIGKSIFKLGKGITKLGFKGIKHLGRSTLKAHKINKDRILRVRESYTVVDTVDLVNTDYLFEESKNWD